MSRKKRVIKVWSVTTTSEPEMYTKTWNWYRVNKVRLSKRGLGDIKNWYKYYDKKLEREGVRTKTLKGREMIWKDSGRKVGNK